MSSIESTGSDGTPGRGDADEFTVDLLIGENGDFRKARHPLIFVIQHFERAKPPAEGNLMFAARYVDRGKPGPASLRRHRQSHRRVSPSALSTSTRPYKPTT